MKVTAKSCKKKEVFKPITITLEIVIESEEELDMFKNLKTGSKFNLVNVECDDNNYTEQFRDIFEEIGEQL